MSEGAKAKVEIVTIPGETIIMSPQWSQAPTISQLFD